MAGLAHTHANTHSHTYAQSLRVLERNQTKDDELHVGTQPFNQKYIATIRLSRAFIAVCFLFIGPALPQATELFSKEVREKIELIDVMIAGDA